MGIEIDFLRKEQSLNRRTQEKGRSASAVLVQRKVYDVVRDYGFLTYQSTYQNDSGDNARKPLKPL